MADLIYDSFLKDNASGAIDLDTDAINCMLVTAAYAANRAHAKRSDVTNEVTGTGYTAGGKPIATPSVVVNGSTHVVTFDGSDVSWSASTITARAAVLYKARGGAPTADELIAYLDFGSDIVSSNGPFTVQFNANGILSWQQT